jgi:hypothetical protein
VCVCVCVCVCYDEFVLFLLLLLLVFFLGPKVRSIYRRVFVVVVFVVGVFSS